MTSLDFAKAVLEYEKKAVKVLDIWKIGESLGLTKELNLTGKTPWFSFTARIYADLKENQNSIFEKIQDKPIMIKLKNQNVTQSNQENEVKIAKKENKFIERDLHPLLSYFVGTSEKFDTLTKTIYHENSEKNTKGIDKWIHPDLVGVKFDYNFEPNLLNFINKFAKTPVILYSFELKIALKPSNLKEYYMQAYSNSSWANEGYLVVLDLDERDEELIDEIRKLNSSFGIGVIKLDKNDPAQSEIIAQAKFKESLDLGAMNNLANKNKDFKAFLKSVCEFDYKNRMRFLNEFEEILTQEQMQEHLKKYKICESI